MGQQIFAVGPGVFAAVGRGGHVEGPGDIIESLQMFTALKLLGREVAPKKHL